MLQDGAHTLLSPRSFPEIYALDVQSCLQLHVPLGSGKRLKAVGLAGLVPSAAGLQQDETDMQQHEGSMLPHKLSRTISQSLTAGEDELGHPVCDVSCNGEKYHVVGHKGGEKRGSCWGSFNFVRFAFPYMHSNVGKQNLCRVP